MALFGNPLEHTIWPIFPALLVHFCHSCSSHPHHCLTDLEREPLYVQHTSMSSESVNALIADS